MSLVYNKTFVVKGICIITVIYSYYSKELEKFVYPIVLLFILKDELIFQNDAEQQ